jgi:hypothetical protein
VRRTLDLWRPWQDTQAGRHRYGFLQPLTSAQWYRRKFSHGNSRLRKIGVVALARKLLIAFWRYLEAGVVPEGAVLRAYRGRCPSAADRWERPALVGGSTGPRPYAPNVRRVRSPRASTSPLGGLTEFGYSASADTDRRLFTGLRPGTVNEAASRSAVPNAETTTTGAVLLRLLVTHSFSRELLNGGS